MTLPASAPAAVTSVAHSIPWLPAEASWLSILQGCIPVVIAGMVAWVGWRQLKTARAKFNLDLFQHRMECFNATWNVLSEAHHFEEPTKCLEAFLDMIPKGEFLFGADVARYMNLIRENIQRSRTIGALMRANSKMIESTEAYGARDALGKSTVALMNEQQEIVKWMLDQALPCKAVFASYMSFGNRR